MKKLFAILLCASTHLHSSVGQPAELLLHEFAMVKENPNTQYVYVGNDIKATLAELATLSPLSVDFDRVYSSLRDGRSIMERETMKQVIDECSSLVSSSLIADAAARIRLKDTIDKYRSAIENGQALIAVDDAMDEKTQTRTLRIRSGLIVVDFLKLYGNLDVTENVVIGRDLTVEGDSFLGGTVRITNLLVNGEPVVGTNSEGGGSVTGPASSNNNAIALFSGTLGNTLKQSPAPVTIDGSNNMASVNNITMNGSLLGVNVTLSGELNLPATSSSSVGLVTINSSPFLHAAGGTTNTFVGNAGNFTLTGTNNTGVGNNALSAVTSGTANTALGSQALSGANCSQNIAIGYQAGLNASGTGDNVIIGYQAATGGVTGNGNVLIGNTVANLLTSGSNNVMIGVDAGDGGTTTGSNNTYIGTSAGFGLNESNTIRITSGGNACFISGINGVSVGAGTQVFVNSNGQLGTVTTSSKRYKHDIQSLPDITSSIAKMRPVTFRYNPDICKEQKLRYGLIAEEVYEIMPEIVTKKDGEIEGVEYEKLPMLMLKALQTTMLKNKKLEGHVAHLIKRVMALEEKMSSSASSSSQASMPMEMPATPMDAMPMQTTTVMPAVTAESMVVEQPAIAVEVMPAPMETQPMATDAMPMHATETMAAEPVMEQATAMMQEAASCVEQCATVEAAQEVMVVA